uniref:Crystallin J1C n=1 Tax=Dicentrarchus labrax TaxID=13489 RepID=A0A8C4I4B9_DICLA
MAAALANRAIGAIVGSTVADAAAQPLHWVYDLQKLQGILAQCPNPEFHPESANPFYRRQTGQQSCYGDQAFVLLESLAECGGLNVDDLKQRTLKFFGPGSEYDTPVNDPYRERGGPRPQLPIEGPWRHASLKSFLKNLDAGKEETGCESDCQIDGIAKLAPIVAFYAGKPDMLDKVEQAIRVTQNNDECVAETLAAARFLEYFILNGPDPKALDSVLDQLNDPNRKQPQELDKAVIGLPGAFQAALHGVLTAKHYEQAVRDTMICGGCTCSRGSFIGACLGAQVGLEEIPASWTSKTLHYDSVLELAKKITKHHQ